MSGQAAPDAALRPPFAVDVITLVPQLWPSWLAPDSGLVGRAFERGLATLRTLALRDFGRGVHRQVDDTPYGGGAGMVLAAPPLSEAIAAARARTPGPVILLGPRGAPLTHATARQLAQGPGMVLICGRYEGVDERVRREVDLELSIGDFVLSAGDPAALCLIDATVRLLPNVLGNAASLGEESFSDGLLEYPHYTRPAEFAGMRVPEVLLGGNHSAIARWRRDQAQQLTRALRPDLACQPSEGRDTCGAQLGGDRRR